ncbi:PEGA domain-containing protein [Lachnospiraceae bacterium JLR.KK008]
MALFVLSLLALSGCGSAGGVNIDFLKGGTGEAAKTENADTGFRVMERGEYDSKDTAVVVKVSEADHKITFLNRIVNKNYTLYYDGTTVITDKYGQAMSVAQLSPGDIVDVNFQHIPKRCVSVAISPSAWEAETPSGFEMNQVRGQLTFNGEVYTLAERMVLLSEGEEIELTDLNERDVLSVKGIENTIYSIQVEKGHGYLRLTGTEYFVDGFIEVGQKMVQKITQDMMLTVPEGAYTVVVRNGIHGGSKETVVYRDEETVLDISDLKGEEVKTGNVFFTLTPADASVYIDGEKIDTSTYVTLEYGVHQMIVKAEGYETISQYLKVGQENANLNVEMEKDGEGVESDKEDDEEEIDEDMGDEDLDEEDTDNYEAYENLPLEPGEGDTGREEEIPDMEPAGEVSAGNGTWNVKVNAPRDAEVYVDGNYVGLAPVSFPKKAGSHVISLRRNGYQTRSYTIQVDEEQKDMELSFSELVRKVEPDLNTLGLGDGAWTDNILSQNLYN